MFIAAIAAPPARAVAKFAIFRQASAARRERQRRLAQAAACDRGPFTRWPGRRILAPLREPPDAALRGAAEAGIQRMQIGMLVGKALADICGK